MNENSLILTSGRLRVSKINRVTKSRFFKELKVGDMIEITVQITRNGSYAKNLRIDNLENGHFEFKSFNELPSLLSCFELEHI